MSGYDEDAPQRWVALARDPGGVLVAVGPLTQRRADMLCRALAEGFEGLEPLGAARLFTPEEAATRLREQQHGRTRPRTQG